MANVIRFERIVVANQGLYPEHRERKIRDSASRFLSSVSQHGIVHFLLLIFVIVCVFDPADKILGAKIPVFVALWIATLLRMLLVDGRFHFAVVPTVYVATFVAIPVLSIIPTFLAGGNLPPEGFALLKGYLLISFALVLIVHRVDLVPQLSAVLTVLACFVVGIFVGIQFNYSWVYKALQPLGYDFGLLYLGKRSFGNYELLQIYFVTSPMLVIAVAYYFDRAMSELDSRRKLLFFAITAINIVGMFLGGTRNNIFISLLTPALLWPFYTRRSSISALCGIGVIVVLGLLFAGYLKAFFDFSEAGNNARLTTMQDYVRIFSDPATLMFGQGLGTYYNWSARGPFYVSELTYMEIIRNFGLFGGLPMMALMSLPLAHAVFMPTSRRDKVLAMAYFLYLVMSASNPMFFSSTGILILAILVANIFTRQNRETVNPENIVLTGARPS
jgi:hypothetical protein